MRRGAARRRAATSVFYSSGSVGPSKAVPLTDENLAAAALAFVPWSEIRAAGDRLAIGLSPAQIFGVRARRVERAARRRGGASSSCPAAIRCRGRRLARRGRRPAAERPARAGGAACLAACRVRAVRCGGGRSREEDARAIERIERASAVRTGYGLTESAGSAPPARRPAAAARDSSGSVRAGPRASRIVREPTGRASRAGEPGEIRMRGPAVFGGLPLGRTIRRPSTREGRLRTGDVGRPRRGSGELSRARAAGVLALRSGGRMLCAEEVEAAIAEHPGVAERRRRAARPRVRGPRRRARTDSPRLLDEIRATRHRRLPAFARPRGACRVVVELPLPRRARWIASRPRDGSADPPVAVSRASATRRPGPRRRALAQGPRDALLRVRRRPSPAAPRRWRSGRASTPGHGARAGVLSVEVQPPSARSARSPREPGWGAEVTAPEDLAAALAALPGAADRPAGRGASRRRSTAALGGRVEPGRRLARRTRRDPRPGACSGGRPAYLLRLRASIVEPDQARLRDARARGGGARAAARPRGPAAARRDRLPPRHRV